MKILQIFKILILPLILTSCLGSGLHDHRHAPSSSGGGVSSGVQASYDNLFGSKKKSRKRYKSYKYKQPQKSVFGYYNNSNSKSNSSYYGYSSGSKKKSGYYGSEYNNGYYTSSKKKKKSGYYKNSKSYKKSKR